jgi:sarcosine oxidase subunit gamma
MVEVMIRRGAFDGLALPKARTRFVATDAGPRRRFLLRATPDQAASVGAVFGVAPGHAACRAVTTGERAALWLGPDEWLLIAPDDAAISEAALQTAAGSGAVVDVSHRNAALLLSGSRVAEVINSANPLDLSLEAFPVGMCTRTIFAKAEVVLWRTGAAEFHLELWRSFAGYVVGQLAEGAREFEV